MKEAFMKQLFAACVSIVIAASVMGVPIHKHVHALPGEYMVLLDTSIGGAAYDGIVQSLSATYGLTIRNEWREEPRGFLCTNVKDEDIGRLAEDPRVSLIEQNFQLISSGIQTVTFNGSYIWDLDRIDETSQLYWDNTYNMCPEGNTVYAYVIDNGVRADHEQFQGRVVLSMDFTDGTTTGRIDTNNGCPAYPSAWHGTAVASVLAGKDLGASHAKIISLRMLDCNGNGSASYVINAVKWIRSSNDPYRYYTALVNYSGAVANWDVEHFPTLNQNVQDLFRNKNIPFFTAADNFSADSCQFSPSAIAYTNVNHSGSVFSAGGTSMGAGADWAKDYRWQEWDGGLARIGVNSGSNAGACVSIYAPAYAIYAAKNTAVNAYTTDSQRLAGTSFASPLVAGVAARYIQAYSYYSAYEVYDYLLASAASTGTPIYNVYTPEYWMCLGMSTYVTSRTPFANNQCPPGTTGLGNSTTPIHYPVVGNSSNANILYSGGLSCP